MNIDDSVFNDGMILKYPKLSEIPIQSKSWAKSKYLKEYYEAISRIRHYSKKELKIPKKKKRDDSATTYEKELILMHSRFIVQDLKPINSLGEFKETMKTPNTHLGLILWHHRKSNNIPHKYLNNFKTDWFKKLKNIIKDRGFLEEQEMILFHMSILCQYVYYWEEIKRIRELESIRFKKLNEAIKELDRWGGLGGELWGSEEFWSDARAFIQGSLNRLKIKKMHYFAVDPVVFNLLYLIRNHSAKAVNSLLLDLFKYLGAFQKIYSTDYTPFDETNFRAYLGRRRKLVHEIYQIKLADKELVKPT